jgi:hypothetical protein
LPRLVYALALARGDGHHARLLKSLARVELLILDDWEPAPMTAEQRRGLFRFLRRAAAGLWPSNRRISFATSSAESTRPTCAGPADLARDGGWCALRALPTRGHSLDETALCFRRKRDIHAQ